jgi:hypothetical protein
LGEAFDCLSSTVQSGRKCRAIEPLRVDERLSAFLFSNLRIDFSFLGKVAKGKGSGCTQRVLVIARIPRNYGPGSWSGEMQLEGLFAIKCIPDYAVVGSLFFLSLVMAEARRPDLLPAI